MKEKIEIIGTLAHDFIIKAAEKSIEPDPKSISDQNSESESALTIDLNGPTPGLSLEGNTANQQQKSAQGQKGKGKDKEEVTKGGIVIPDTVKERPQEGKVIAVGPGSLSEDGNRIAMDVKVGDVVVYARYGGQEYKIEDEEVIFLKESDVLAKKTK